MEHEGSFLCSHELVTGAIPKPDESSPHFPYYFFKIRSNIVLQSTTRCSEWSLPFRFPGQEFVCIFHLSCACYITRPPNLSWFDLALVQVMKLLNMQPSPFSWYFLSLPLVWFSVLYIY